MFLCCVVAGYTVLKRRDDLSGGIAAMNNPSADLSEDRLWCFPDWARAAGIIAAVFAVLDLLHVFAELVFPLGFILAMAGVPCATRNIEKARQEKAVWLPIGYLAWAFVELVLQIALMIMPGMASDYLTGISFRAPFWLAFGLWLAYWSHQVIKRRRLPCEKNDELVWCRTSLYFRMSLVMVAAFILAGSLPLIHIQCDATHTASFMPLHAEFMTMIGNNTSSGKIGSCSFIQSMLDQVLKPAFSAGFPGLWWFTAQIVLLPLAWFVSRRPGYLWLKVFSILTFVSVAGIPLQFKLQYGQPLVGASGTIQPSYWFILIIALFQIWSVGARHLSAAEKNGQAGAVDDDLSGEHDRLAVVSAKRALVAAVLLTFALPFLMQSALDALSDAADAKKTHRFAALLEKVKREVDHAPLEVALCQAIDRRQHVLVEWLLTQKPNVDLLTDKRGYRPLWWAIRAKGDPVITEMLLQAGADPNLELSEGSGKTALGLAMSLHYGRDEGLKYVRMLASYGADLNKPVDQSGILPIGAALNSQFKPSSELVRELMRLGADPLRQKTGNLFFLALLDRDPEVLKDLAAAGINQLAVDNKGNTFLHLMCNLDRISERDAESFRYANYLPDVINLKNNSGKTVLHIAAERNDPQMVETLLKWKADQDCADNEGESPRQLAEKRRYLRLLGIMDKYRQADSK
jgi:ankyrin repeat protein